MDGTESKDTAPPTEPIFRPTARVVLLNESDRVLLFRVKGARGELWILPGGALDPGESWEECAQRELQEETGIEVDTLGPCVWTGTDTFNVAGKIFKSPNRIFIVRVDGEPAVDTSGLDEMELEFTLGYRWWSLRELVNTSDEMRPHGIAELLPPLIAGHILSQPLEIQIAPADND